MQSATLAIADDGNNIIFDQDRTGTRVRGSSLTFSDAVDWVVIGPGTWYVRLTQLSTTLNTCDLVWNLRDRVPLPNDDHYGGVWTESATNLDRWKDGRIRSGAGYRGSDVDWFMFDLEDDGETRSRWSGATAKEGRLCSCSTSTAS